MKYLLIISSIFFSYYLIGQDSNEFTSLSKMYDGLKFRNIGPYRGGRSVASTGVIGDPLTYYMGSTGGGLWKTSDAGVSWVNVSDGYFNTGSVGAIAVSSNDDNIVFTGMGEHPVRGVMTSHGDGVYRSNDAGTTWDHVGLTDSRHIAEIKIHPDNPDLVYVAVQGAVFGNSEERGIYRTNDGGDNWEKILCINESTGASDISMDHNNPRILYASMWDHRRLPWQVRSGGDGSGIYKSIDGGDSWEQLEKGLPKDMGKVSVDVSPANSNIVYANIEAEKEKGGVYKSIDGGKTWTQTTSDRTTVARAWYYIEIFADPIDENTVYVLNAPMLKSIDGGKTFNTIRNPHGDQHHMWINPVNSNNIILSNDGGACITFNGGSTWSTQSNQPTGQFYRVITDHQFPYKVYGGQQDNTSVIIPSRTSSTGIGWRDWTSGPGCESAFLAFDPEDPSEVFGTCIQGAITAMDMSTHHERDVMAYPIIGLGSTTSEMKYRFNWNPPVVSSLHDPRTIYHAGNIVLKSTDRGVSWSEISTDLTRNDKEKQKVGGVPFTNEAAGGEVYNTIAYLAVSPHNDEVIWTGSDCGLVYTTEDGGKSWNNVTPKGLGEVLINSIEVSPHNPATVYLAATNYKFDDFEPMFFMTKNNGKSWRKINDGIPDNDWTRVIREDKKVPGLLFGGTENGLYVSFDKGNNWDSLQLNLPICPITDLTFQDNDLIVATSGRAFWILDDLSAIQELGAKANKLTLISPKHTVRMFSGGGFRPGEVYGQNPKNGVIIDYFMPAEKDSTELILEIKNSDGELIKTYSSKKDEQHKKYIGGPASQKTLTTKKGLNRFAWDMKKSILPGVEGVFMLGGYDGTTVVPGKYQLVLTYGDHSSEVDVTILADPRIEASQDDYNQQYAAISEIEESLIDIHNSINHMRMIKKQMKAFKSNFKNIEKASDLIELSDSIMTKIDIWEGKLIQKEQKTFQDVINFENKLNAEMANLMSVMNSADPVITKGMNDRKRDLLLTWNDLKLFQKNILEDDLSAFNQSFSDSELSLIQVNE